MGLLDPAHVLLDPRARSKRALISELADLIPSIDPDQVIEVIMARERLGSTGIGHGVALPHGRLPQLDRPILALARHPTGVDFDAIDGEPARIVAMLLAPERDGDAHLKLLARLARLLQRPEVREAILRARSAEEVSALFDELAVAA